MILFFRLDIHFVIGRRSLSTLYKFHHPYRVGFTNKHHTAANIKRKTKSFASLHQNKKEKICLFKPLLEHAMMPCGLCALCFSLLLSGNIPQVGGGRVKKKLTCKFLRFCGLFIHSNSNRRRLPLKHTLGLHLLLHCGTDSSVAT